MWQARSAKPCQKCPLRAPSAVGHRRPRVQQHCDGVELVPRAHAPAAHVQGLTTVLYTAQLEPVEPFLTSKHTQNIPGYPLKTPPKQPLTAPPVTQKALKLS
jgi:hypothetical protein